MQRLAVRLLFFSGPKAFQYACCSFPGLFYAIFYLLYPADFPLLMPDSASYIEMSGTRNIGYPIFLSTCLGLGLRLTDVVWIQVAFFSVSLIFLCIQLCRAMGAILPAFVIGLLCAINPELNKFAFSILTETIFVSLTMIYLGILVRVLQNRSPYQLACLSTVAGLAYAVRPVGAAIITAALIVAFFLWLSSGRRHGLAHAAALLPLAITVGAESMLHQSIHGSRQHSLAGLHAFAKAGLVEAQVPKGIAGYEAGQILHDALEQDLENVRELIASAPTSYTARYLTVQYETFIQYRFAVEERAAATKAYPQGNALLQIALQRLRFGLGDYTVLTWRHYLSLWNLYDATYPGHARTVNEYLAAKAPLPLSESFREILVPARTTGVTGRIVRPVVQGMGLTTALLAAIGLLFLVRPGQAPPFLAAAGMACLLIHGYCLLVAMTGLGIARYLLVLWPAIITALGLAVWQAILALDARSMSADEPARGSAALGEQLPNGDHRTDAVEQRRIQEQQKSGND